MAGRLSCDTQPEAGYTELRESDVDYLEANSVDDVLGALERLRTRPSLFEQMVENGRQRAASYTQDAVLDAWEAALRQRIIPGFAYWRHNNASSAVRSLRHAIRVARRRLWGTQAVQTNKRTLHSAFYRMRRAVIMPPAARS
jgi:hypothetical protein